MSHQQRTTADNAAAGTAGSTAGMHVARARGPGAAQELAAPTSAKLRLEQLVRRMPGLNTGRYAALLGLEVRRVANVASRLVAAGRLVWTGHTKMRCYHPADAAPEGARGDIQRRSPRAPNGAGRARSAASAWQGPQGEVVNRGDVKVTLCPSGTDHRFSFTPPPGWQGEITRDWMRRRRAERAERASRAGHAERAEQAACATRA